MVKDDNVFCLIGRFEVVVYCGIMLMCFSMWVLLYKMLLFIFGICKWDKKVIDVKLDEISGLVGNENEDLYEKWMWENDGCVIIVVIRELKYWEVLKKKCDKFCLLMGLDVKF